MADVQLSYGDDVKTRLLRVSEPFRRMVTEHQVLDEKIRSLANLSFLTDQQQYEEASLKKQKLALKDRIEAMIRGRDVHDLAPSPGQ